MKNSKKSGIPDGDIIWIVLIAIGTGALMLEIIIKTYFAHYALP